MKPRPFPRLRKMTWVLICWTVLMGIWLASAAGSSADCTGQYKTACQSGEAVGRGIGVTFVFVIWALGFLCLGLVWLMSRPRS